MRSWGRRGWGRAVLAACLASGALAVVSPPVGAQGQGLETVDEPEIHVDAESMTYDQRLESITATGDVVIRRGDTFLRADEVRFSKRTSEAEAIGNVRLTDIEGVVSAERAALNMEEETGELQGAEVYSATRGYSLRGDRIEKGCGQSYHIENGRFTTCRCAQGPPSWSIAGKTLDVMLAGYGVLRGGTFNVLDVPVFYLPHVVLPIQRERQSGLLLPRVGLSNKRGFQILQPFYWAIDKSQDATFGFDLETSARIGLLGEYRYAASRTIEGMVNASYFNEFFRGAATEVSTGRLANPHVPENRWGLLTENAQRLEARDAYADLLVVGDNLFLREINTFTIDHDREVALRTLPFTESRIGMVQRWERMALHASSTVYQDLINPQSQVLQRVPEVNLTGQKLLWLGAQGQFASSVVDFQRGHGTAGFRLDVEPGVQLRLPLGRSVFGAVSARLRETAYQLTDTEMEIACTTDQDCPAGAGCGSDGFCVDSVTGETTTESLPGTQNRATVELRADLGTSLSRTFDFPYLGAARLKHTIEPQVEYFYIPSVYQNDVPSFDGLDRIGERHLISYGVASRLLARTAPPAGTGPPRGQIYELARASVMQSYDVDRRIASIGDPPNTGDHFSDIDLALRVNPNRYTAVRVGSSYDTGSTQVSQATVGVRLQEPLDPGAGPDDRRLAIRNTFAVSYRFITDNLLQQLGGSVALRLTDRLGLLYATRYDIPQSRFLENYVGVRVVSACDCWSLVLGVTDKSNPNEVELHAQFTLVGIGSTGPEPRFGRTN